MLRRNRKMHLITQKSKIDRKFNWNATNIPFLVTSYSYTIQVIIKEGILC